MDTMFKSSRLTKFTVASGFLMLIFTAAQLWESNRQSRTAAAISFISLHNNERLYDARQQLFDLEADILARLSPDEITNLPPRAVERLLRDWRLSLNVSATEKQKLDFRGMSLVQLYDATSKCMQRGVCKFDITDHHFADMARKVVTSYQKQIPIWRQVYQLQDLGQDACMLAEGKVYEENLLQASLSLFGATFDNSADVEACDILQGRSTS